MTVARTKRSHSLRLEAVTHRFGDFTAVRDIALDIAGGEMVALLGPSGCGKSTLLRIVAGFIAQSEGRVLVDGEAVDALPPNRRGVGIVFQNYALFPHMGVAENVAYGLQAQRMPKERVRSRVDDMLRLVHMESFAGRLPRQLSGGQQQRVALARALAVDPKFLLLDEPFGALDKNLRLDMQIEVKRLQRDYGITTIIVTHDQEEALSLADRIAVMNAGRIEQCAPPSEIYDRPETLFVNRFVGHTNMIPGTFEGARRVRLEDGSILECAAPPELSAGADILVSIRPERLRVAAAAGANAFPATVKVSLPLGPQIVYECENTKATPIKLNLPREGGGEPLAPGARIFLQPVAAAACQVFVRPPTSR